MTITRGDTGVDRSTTHVDSSSRVTTSTDDHSVRTNTITDNSVRNTTIHADNNQRIRHSRWSWNWGGSTINIVGGGGTLVAVAAMVIVALVAIRREPGSVPALPPVGPTAPAADSVPLAAPPGMLAVAASGSSAQFFIDAAEVTAAAYGDFVVANPQWRKDRLPANEHDGDYLGGTREADPTTVAPDRPIVFITFAAADAYCRWRGHRLPTEDEWALAARVQPAGLANMAGSVWEWTTTSDGGLRVLRGSGFQQSPEEVRAEARVTREPTFTAPDLGFRCVADLPARQ